MEHSTLTFVAIEAALGAGELIKKGYGTTYRVDSKPGGIQDLVTEYDRISEQFIISHIRKFFPDHAFLAEESGSTPNRDPTHLWIIDPLDGTVNFAHQIPFFAVSIAASYKNDVQVGVIYVPMTQELFISEKGRGAYLNGTKLQVRHITNYERAIAATGFSYQMNQDPVKSLDQFNAIARLGSPIRNLGSAAINLAYLAAGRFDVFWTESLQPWDWAAGKLMVEEAGGKVTHFDGTLHKIFGDPTLLATNGHLHDEILLRLNGASH